MATFDHSSKKSDSNTKPSRLTSSRFALQKATAPQPAPNPEAPINRNLDENGNPAWLSRLTFDPPRYSVQPKLNADELHDQQEQEADRPNQPALPMPHLQRQERDFTPIPEQAMAQMRSWSATQSPVPPQTQPQPEPNIQAQSDPVPYSRPAWCDRLTFNPQRPSMVQAKLTVGAPNDQYEQEADAVAAQVMAMPKPTQQPNVQKEAIDPPNEEEEAVQTKPLAHAITPLLQREAAPEAEEDEIQAKLLATAAIQREAMPEDEGVQAKPLAQPLDQRIAGTLQRDAMPEDEAVQPKPLGNAVLQREAMPEAEEEELQAKPLNGSAIQREAAPEADEEELQTKRLEAAAVQREALPDEEEAVQTKPLGNAVLQREAMPQEEETVQPKRLQRFTDGSLQADSNLETQLSSSRGGGSPLSDDVRSFMEPRFGADLSQVRVHTGASAVQMNKDLSAQAFTHKQDIFFGAGKSPGKNDLTAHELTHVVQQTGKVNRKLGNESQTQPESNVTTKPLEPPKEATSASQDTTHVNSASKIESAHSASSQQDILSTQPNSLVVVDKVVPNQVGLEGNQFSAATTNIGNIASGKPAETELHSNSSQGEVSNKLEVDLQADAKQSDKLAQPIGEATDDLAYLNSEDTEAEPPPESSGVPEPALPESPDLAQAAQQIMQRSEGEKAALSQAAEAQRNAVMQQAEAIAKTIEATTQSKTQAIITDLESKKAGVTQTINTTKASVKGQIANQKMLAQAEGTKSLEALHKEVETKRKAAADASETEAKQTEQTGQTEAKRVMTSSAESSARVHTVSNQKANSSSSKPEVRSTVREAIGQTATDVTGKMQQRSQDLAKNAQEASQKTAKGLRDAGKSLASGIGNNTTQVEKAIQDGTNATVNQIANQEVQSQQKLDALQVQALTSLEKLKAQSVADIKQSGQMAAAAARKTGQTSATQINKAKTASLQQFDKGVNQAVGQLNQVPAGRKVNKKVTDQLIQEAGSKLQQANTQLGAMISEQATSSQASLNQLGVAFPGHLDSTQQKVTAEANKATTGLNSGLAGVPTQIAQASQQAITENKNANQQAVQQFGDGLQQQIDKAKQGWSQEKEKVSNDIRSKIDEGVKSNKDVESKAPADFTELANTAAAKAEESLVSKIFSGIWEGIKKVAIGLAIFIAVVLVITAVVLVVAAIAGIAVVASEVLLAVAAIVGVGFLLYGFITAMIKRSDDFWKTYGTNIPWYAQVGGFFAVLGVAIGDAVGITPIIEGIVGKEAFTGKEFTSEQRAEKITEGVLTLGLMFIMGKVLKGIGKPGKVPGEIKPGEVKPGEVKPGEVKPGEVKPGEVKPLEAKLGNKVSADRLIAELGEERANKLVDDLTPDTVNKLLKDLTPTEIQSFVDKLGSAAKVKTLAEKYGGEALKHYGPEFFKDYKGVTQDTINHLLQNDGVVKGEIKGCHDQATFLNELNGRGEVTSTTPDPANPDVVRYEYKLYQKDSAGNIKQPPTLSTGKPKLKTVIKDLASDSNKWREIGNEAADEAIKNKTFPKDGGSFEGTGKNIRIRGFYRPNQVDTFFPNF